MSVFFRVRVKTLSSWWTTIKPTHSEFVCRNSMAAAAACTDRGEQYTTPKNELFVENTRKPPLTNPEIPQYMYSIACGDPLVAFNATKLASNHAADPTSVYHRK
jgi:hypothetical protein